MIVEIYNRESDTYQTVEDATDIQMPDVPDTDKVIIFVERVDGTSEKFSGHIHLSRVQSDAVMTYNSINN
jgi:hypothetical protein